MSRHILLMQHSIDQIKHYEIISTSTHQVRTVKVQENHVVRKGMHGE